MTKNEAIRKLTILRDQLAAKTGVENFKILKYETIDLIASSMPKTLDELLAVKGIGKKKLEQFGQKILDTINDSSNDLEENLFSGQDAEHAAHSTQHIAHNILEFSGNPPTATQLGGQRKNKNVLSVGEFLDGVNDLMGDTFTEILIRGEITEFKEHSSGIYLTLKDKEEDSVLNCYIPPGVYFGLGFSLEAGMEIKITGVPNIWKPKGRFSMRVESVELAGEGTLKKSYELLKKKLEVEGLFDRRRELPEFITNIGVITSGTGAVIGDFRNNLLALDLKINFYDSRVEGTSAVGDIRRGIKWFNKNKPGLDAIIIIRGGGSLEDLQAFNNELVARDIFASRIPTICGIGHDRDIPMACLVSDRAESTPTATAILINNSWDRLITELPNYKKDIVNNFRNILNKANLKLRSYSLSLNHRTGSLATLSDKYLAKLQNVADKIDVEIKRARKSTGAYACDIFNCFAQTYTLLNKKLENDRKYLKNVSPERNLKLGYSVTTNTNGKVIRDLSGFKIGDEVKTKLYKSEFKSKISKLCPKGTNSSREYSNSLTVN